MSPQKTWIVLAVFIPMTWVWAGQDEDYRKAHHLYTLHEYKLACEALGRFLKQYRESERADQARLLLAESYYQLKSFKEAAREFDRFLTDYPKSSRRPEALQRAVKVHYLSKQFDMSVKRAEVFLAENAARLDGAGVPPALPALFTSVCYYAGDGCYALKRFAQARKLWEQLLKRFPKAKLAPDAAEGLGWIAFGDQRYQDAIRHFAVTAGTPAHPKAAASQLMIARALDKLGKGADALTELSKVSGIGGGDGLAREVAMFRAAFLLNGKQYEQAVNAYRALVKAFPKHPETAAALVAAVDQLESGNRPAETLAAAELYLNAFPGGVERAAVARSRARSLAELKRPKEALAAAKDALKEAERLRKDAESRDENIVAALMLLGDYSGTEGAAHYATVVRKYGDSPFARTARYQLAYLAWKQGRLEETLTQAEGLLKALVGKADDRELRRKGLFAAADAAFRLERYEQAERHLKAYLAMQEVQAAAEKSHLDLVELRLAWCRSKAKDPAAAVKQLDSALTRGSGAALKQEMLYLRGRSKLDLKDMKGAQADFESLWQSAPGARFTAHACYDLAEALYAEGKVADCLPWLDKLLGNEAFKSVPVWPDGLLLRAKVLYKTKAWAKALVDIETILGSKALKGQRRPILLLKALCLESLKGKDAEADAAYGALIDAGPSDASEVRQARLRRGRMRFDAKRFGDARKDLRAYLDGVTLKAGDDEAQEVALRMAMCLKAEKDLNGARTWLMKLNELALTGVMAFEVRFQLGNLAYEAEKNADAAQHYEKALAAATVLKTLPKSTLSAAWLNLAWARLRGGEKKTAADAFGVLLKLDPTGPYSAEARYHRGCLLSEDGKAAEAMALWKELIEKQSDNPLLEKTLPAMGEAQAKSSLFPEAVVSFEAYLAKFGAKKGAGDKTTREVWCGLGECLVQTKNPEKARAAFTKALGEKGLASKLDEIGERALLGIAELDLAQGKAGACKKNALDLVIKRPGSKWLDAALFLCGRANEELAAPEQAIACYRQLLKKRPKSPRAETARERLKALGAPVDQ